MFVIIHLVHKNNPKLIENLAEEKKDELHCKISHVTNK